MSRLRVGLVAGAVLVALTLPAGATAQAPPAPPTSPPTDPSEPPPPPIDETPTEPPGVEPPPVQTFSDVAAGDTHAETIELVAALGWAGGYADGTYRPGAEVQRGQMATFLSRATYLTLGAGSSPFTDTAGSVHEAAIVAVADAGIAGGYADGSFRPTTPVTRGQMASFLVRAFGLPAATGASSYPDVAGSTHAAAISAVEQAGVAGGFSDGTFRPGAPVTRAQMATFLVRAATS